MQFECYFDYLVNIRANGNCQAVLSNLQLRGMCKADLLHEFADWHIERMGYPSRFLQIILSTSHTLARYYFNADDETVKNLHRLKASIDLQPVLNKKARWNSLATLEQVGLAEYERAHSMTIIPREEQRSGLLPANTVQRSLIIRLLVRRPLRSRNVREMKLGENLFQENGRWIIELQGEQMKVARRGDRLNIFRVTFPASVVPLLEEFLEIWRPILNVNDLSNVFVTKTGRPFTSCALNQTVRGAVYAYAGCATNIHLFRDIWATEFITATQDFITAAQMLNDDVRTVLAHYAHLRTQNASNTADEFLTTALGVV